MYSVVLALPEHSSSSQKQQKKDNILSNGFTELAALSLSSMNSEWNLTAETSRNDRQSKEVTERVCRAAEKLFLADAFHSEASKHRTFSVNSLWQIFRTTSVVRTKFELTLHC